MLSVTDDLDKTIPLEDAKKTYNDCPIPNRTPGIYVVWVDPKKRKQKWGKGVPRLLDRDKQRILAIGQSTNLRTRIREFRKCLDVAGGHHGGNLLRILNRMARLDIEESELNVSWKSDNTPKIAEQKWINSYVEDFGEVPPLNAGIPNRKALSEGR